MEETAAAFFEHHDVSGAPRELIALGGRLDVDTLVAAYRNGCFPWPSSDQHREGPLERHARRLALTGGVPLLPGTDLGGPLMPWMSPHPRPVLLPDRVVISRSLRKRLRHCGWETTMDRAFDDVVAGCADRAETWISPEMRAAYCALHRAGWAHSLEVWSGDDLVGGLYGILTGRVFAGESMFHRVPDASKAAVVDLCHRLVRARVVLIDTQDQSVHMTRLGQFLVHRDDYLQVVYDFRDEPVALPTVRRPVSRLVAAAPDETRG
jgi:leucyl/phenylalanyl-tRNA--protein transferase